MKKNQKVLTPKPLRRRKIKTVRPLSLGPDGVEFIVDWNAMAPGMSLFVPCLDFQLALNEFNHVCDRLDWTFDYVIRIENGKIGIRFWRTA